MPYLHDCIATGRHPHGDAWTKKISVKKGADRPTSWTGNYNFFIFSNNLDIQKLFNEYVDTKKITEKSANTSRVSGPMTDELVKTFAKNITPLLSNSNYIFSSSWITYHTDKGYVNFDFVFIEKNELNFERPYAKLKLNIHIGKRDSKHHTDSIVLNPNEDLFARSIEKIEWFVNCLKDGTVKKELDKIEKAYYHDMVAEIIEYEFSVKSVTNVLEFKLIEKPTIPDIDTWEELEEEGKESYGSKTNANSFRSNDNDDGEIQPLSSALVKEPPDTWKDLELLSDSSIRNEINTPDTIKNSEGNFNAITSTSTSSQNNVAEKQSEGDSKKSRAIELPTQEEIQRNHKMLNESNAGVKQIVMVDKADQDWFQNPDDEQVDSNSDEDEEEKIESRSGPTSTRFR